MKNTFEIFHASVPRRRVAGWRHPLRLLEQIACYQVRDVSEFLEGHGIAFHMGWYGDPNNGSENVAFRLFLTIPEAREALIFRLWSGIDMVGQGE
jgi:hypothetical protein